MGVDLFYAAVVIGTLLGAAALRAVPLPHRAAASSAFGTLLLCAGCFQRRFKREGSLRERIIVRHARENRYLTNDA